MWQNAELFLCCALVAAASLFGGWLPSILRMTHVRLQITMSFVGGLMLGAAALHLIPHSLHYTNSIDVTMYWASAGLLIVFFLIRWLHVHHHHEAVDDTGEHSHAHSNHDCGDPAHEHTHDHSHDRSLDGDVDAIEQCQTHRSPWSWVGLFVGMSVHSLLDGVALAAGLMAQVGHETLGILGIPTILLAVALHKPLDSLSITAVMQADIRADRWKWIANIAFAAMAPLGALAFSFGVNPENTGIVGGALAFSAGVFICIALADLLPEVRFHSHDRLKLSAALLVGFAVAYGLGFLEPPHFHGEGGAKPEHRHGEDDGHEHDGHQH